MRNRVKQASAEVLSKNNSTTYLVVHRLLKNPSAIVGMVILTVIIMMAVFAPLIAPYSYSEFVGSKLKSPSTEFLFGTDELGRDIFSRIVYGARYSLALGFISTIASVIIGVFFGAICGYFGGIVDDVIMRIFDIVQSIPYILLCITVATVLGNGFDKTIIALAITGTPQYVRIMRVSVMSVKKMDYVEAATSINCSTPRIIFKHIVKNSFAPLIVQATLGVAMQILSAATLSFIGLGVQAPTPEWGAMLNTGKDYIKHYPHVVIAPGLMIVLVVYALNVIGDALRDALDPKLKN
ncbi:MAG: ABC transporter permease [Faecousia sp.]